jgi:hypothetical protein
MLRKLSGAVGGSLAGMVVIEGLLRAGQAIWPLPGPPDPADREAMIAAMRAAPALFLVWTAFAWYVGTTAGVFLAQRLAGSPAERWPATTVEAFLLALSLLHLLTVKPAAWFWILGLAAFPAAYWTGLRLEARARRK